MLRSKLTLAVPIFVAFTSLGILTSAQAAPRPVPIARTDEWADKLHNLIPNSVEGIRVIQDLGALAPDTILNILNANWASLTSPDVKQYILSCMVQNDNPRMLDILDLGVRDNSIAVQVRALQFCESFGFQPFTEDFDAYLKWRDENRGKPLKEVLASSLKAAVAAIPAADDAQRSVYFNILVRTNFSATSQTSRWRREAALSAHLAEALMPWLKEQNNMMWSCFQIVRNIRPGEEFMKTRILPLADPKVETSVRYQALNTLGSPENRWATAPLMKMMLAEYPDSPCEMIGQAISQLGDPGVIPTLISMMEMDNTPEGNRVIGNVLAPLTGVTNSVVRDAKWWRSWWNRNSKRFAADVRSLPFPKVAIRARPAPADLVSPVIRAAQPMLKQVAGDVKKSYWFIDTRPQFQPGGGIRAHNVLRAPAAGGVAPPASPGANMPANPGLIVVLTGDGDGATASAFWQEAARSALNSAYCVAVVNAPRWIDTQTVTWITAAEMKKVKEAKFSAESLLTEVVKDVESYRQIDTSRVLLHSIGAAGMAAYSASLDPQSPFTGYLIASATFRSADLPALDKASGRKYLILNDRDDKTHPFWMAEAAQKLLQQKGALVTLEPTLGYLAQVNGHDYGPALRANIDALLKK
jgi:predicted esterase